MEVLLFPAVLLTSAVLHFYSTKYTNTPGRLELVAAMAVVQENVLSIHGAF